MTASAGRYGADTSLSATCRWSLRSAPRHIQAIPGIRAELVPALPDRTVLTQSTRSIILDDLQYSRTDFQWCTSVLK